MLARRRVLMLRALSRVLLCCLFRAVACFRTCQLFLFVFTIYLFRSVSFFTPFRGCNRLLFCAMVCFCDLTFSRVYSFTSGCGRSYITFQQFFNFSTPREMHGGWFVRTILTFYSRRPAEKRKILSQFSVSTVFAEAVRRQCLTCFNSAKPTQAVCHPVSDVPIPALYRILVRGLRKS